MSGLLWGLGFWIASVAGLVVLIVVLAKGWLAGRW